MRLRLPAAALLVAALLIPATSLEAGMPRVFKRYLAKFDKDHARLSSDFENVHAGSRATLEGYLQRLWVSLKKIPGSYRDDPEFVSRHEMYKALEAKLSGEDPGGGGLPDKLAKAEEAFEAAEVARKGWSVADLEEARATHKEVQEALRAVKGARHEFGSHPEYQPLRDRGAKLVGEIRTRIQELEAEERDGARAARTAARGRTVVTPRQDHSGKSDPDLAREFQSQYNALYNQLRRARGEDYLDDEKIAGWRQDFARLEGITESFQDESQGYVRQCKTNYEALLQHFEKALAKVADQRAANEEAAAAREAEHAAEQARRQEELDRLNAAARDRHGNAVARNQARAEEQARTRAAIATRRQERDEEERRRQEEGARRRSEATGIRVAHDEDQLDALERKTLAWFDKQLLRYRPWFETMRVDNQKDIDLALGRLQTILDEKFSEELLASDSGQARVEALEDLRKQARDFYGDTRPLSEEDKRLMGKVEHELKNGEGYYIREALDPLGLQDPAARESIRGRMEKIEDLAASIPNQEHPAVQELLTRVEALRTQIEDTIAGGQAMAGQAGDVDANLARFQEVFPMDSFEVEVPDPDDWDPREMQELGAKVRQWTDMIPDAQRFFEKAEKLSVKARSPEFQTYVYWFQGDLRSQLRSVMADVDRIEDFARVEHAVHFEVDPDRVHQPHYQEHARETLQRGISTLEGIVAFQEGFHGEAKEESRAKLERFREKLTEVAGGMQAALESARFEAEPATEDPEYLAIAEQALEAEDELGPHQRVVINYGPVLGQTEMEWYDGSWIPWDWDEFQVTFVEERGDEHWITTATIKRYRKGWTKQVRLNEWYVVKYHRWRRILEENIWK